MTPARYPFGMHTRASWTCTSRLPERKTRSKVRLWNPLWNHPISASLAGRPLVYPCSHSRQVGVGTLQLARVVLEFFHQLVGVRV